MFAGSIVKPGLNPLVAPTPSYLYYITDFGTNSSGELGLSNTTNYSSPKQLGSSTNWSSANPGTRHNLAIKTDGTLWAWGFNNKGQLGQGNATNYSSPKQIGALTNWKIAQGITDQSLAIKTDGTLWSWGNNYWGSLGLGTSGNYTQISSPAQIGSLTNWSVVSGRGQWVLAIKTDGTLWSWGYNGYGGALGLGNLTSYSSPKQVGSLTNWLKIAGSNYFASAIKTDGTLWAWGYNGSGMLGLGNITNYSSPKQVGALTNWLSISAGQYHMFAL